jgi:hypothetical protein
LTQANVGDWRILIKKVSSDDCKRHYSAG